MAAGEMSEAEFTVFLKTALQHFARYSVDASIHFVCMDWRHMFELLAIGRELSTDLKNLYVGTKTRRMGSLSRSKPERVLVFKLGSAPHINNVELLQARWDHARLLRRWHDPHRGGADGRCGCLIEFDSTRFMSTSPSSPSSSSLEGMAVHAGPPSVQQQNAWGVKPCHQKASSAAA